MKNLKSNSKDMKCISYIPNCIFDAMDNIVDKIIERVEKREEIVCEIRWTLVTSYELLGFSFDEKLVLAVKTLENLSGYIEDDTEFEKCMLKFKQELFKKLRKVLSKEKMDILLERNKRFENLNKTQKEEI
jgi:hypothetical protein